MKFLDMDQSINVTFEKTYSWPLSTFSSTDLVKLAVCRANQLFLEEGYSSENFTIRTDILDNKVPPKFTYKVNKKTKPLNVDLLYKLLVMFATETAFGQPLSFEETPEFYISEGKLNAQAEQKLVEIESKINKLLQTVLT